MGKERRWGIPFKVLTSSELSLLFAALSGPSLVVLSRRALIALAVMELAKKI